MYMNHRQMYTNNTQITEVKPVLFNDFLRDCPSYRTQT